MFNEIFSGILMWCGHFFNQTQVDLYQLRIRNRPHRDTRNVIACPAITLVP